MVIVTKYLAPTTNKGARVQAKSSQGKKVVLPWDYALSTYHNHERALKQLIDRMDLVEDTVIAKEEEGLLVVICGYKR
jgi:hypothetical protein